MSASKEFTAYAMDLLSPLGNITHHRMFGGVSLKHQGKQFAMIMGNTLYLRVDEASRPEFEAADMRPFSYQTKKGEVVVRSYYSTPEEAFEDREEFLRYAQQAIRSSHG
ncbi:MAG: TfoX/Sxy family protein [bacterium]